ncbi:hypothetical protein Scep_003442 [Stephania cephalantha]|uniref:U-box domain-containing protein n=1 Tax=Stephania cephalantha TaxID=152367 RepID=A0AAP0KQH9_9MAGN
MGDQVEVPPYFLCPISLEIMRDPVTLSTGITYDRESIERWMFSNKTKRKNDDKIKNVVTCPVTKQALLDTQVDLTPNHTLRRLIQAWCTLNAASGIERFPTPKPPVEKADIEKLIEGGAMAAPDSAMLSKLKRMKSLAKESERNKRCIESAGAVQFLSSIVMKTSSTRSSSSSSFVDDNDNDNGVSIIISDGVVEACAEEALSILYNLEVSETGLKSLIGKNNGEFVGCLVQVLRHGNYRSRTYAALLLKPVLEVADTNIITSLGSDVFDELVTLLSDQVSQQSLKAALKTLILVCPWGRNRIKAVESGAVSMLIEMLLESCDRRCGEMILVVLEQLCGCAEGRAEVVKHAAGLAAVSKKILRVSHVGSERAVRVLWLISRFSGTQSVVQEMLQVGVVAKLCLVLQVECTFKTKEKAKEILRLHSRVWRNSSCIPSHLLSSYPSS